MHVREKSITRAGHVSCIGKDTHNLSPPGSPPRNAEQTQKLHKKPRKALRERLGDDREDAGEAGKDAEEAGAEEAEGAEEDLSLIHI